MNPVRVVIAVKGLQRGKHRLAGVLGEAERHRLITTMLGDVLDTVRATPGVGEIGVLTADRSLLPTDVHHVHDEGFGLNAAIARAAFLLAKDGARSMLVLPADLPFATPADIGALLGAAETHDLVISPDVQRFGTNALLLSPPQAIHPRFGPGSFAAHITQAAPVIIDRPGLAHDIDVPTDLFMLVNTPGGRYDFLDAALRKAS